MSLDGVCVQVKHKDTKWLEEEQPDMMRGMHEQAGWEVVVVQTEGSGGTPAMVMPVRGF